MSARESRSKLELPCHEAGVRTSPIWSLSPLRLRRRNKRMTSTGFRRGAAAVELAVCLPVIVVLVFGALEGANILFCRQALVEAAYEASKHASRADGTSSHATTLATEILKARRVNNATITITPANVSTAKPGQEVSVNIKVSAKERTYTSLGIFDNKTIEVTATMQKD